MKVRLREDHRITLYAGGEYDARRMEHGGYELIINETLNVSASEVEELTYQFGDTTLVVGELYDITTTRRGRFYRGRRFVQKYGSAYVFETEAHARTNVWPGEAIITRTILE